MKDLIKTYLPYYCAAFAIGFTGGIATYFWLASITP